MSHYMTDKKLTNKQLRELVDIISSAVDLEAVYWCTDWSDRDLLTSAIKSIYLPTHMVEEE